MFGGRDCPSQAEAYDVNAEAFILQSTTTRITHQNGAIYFTIDKQVALDVVGELAAELALAIDVVGELAAELAIEIDGVEGDSELIDVDGELAAELAAELAIDVDGELTSMGIASSVGSGVSILEDAQDI